MQNQDPLSALIAQLLAAHQESRPPGAFGFGLNANSAHPAHMDPFRRFLFQFLTNKQPHGDTYAGEELPPVGFNYQRSWQPSTPGLVSRINPNLTRN